MCGLYNYNIKVEGATEQLKVDNQMVWVARMNNNIRSRATEIVNIDIIYT